MSTVTAAITLFFVLDPFGNAPIFMAVLGKTDPKRHRRIILRECLIALGILLVFFLVGAKILELLGLTQPALGMAGGLVLFLIALRMLFPRPGGVLGDEDTDGEPFIVPLAVPMMAGPSSIATVMLLHGQAGAASEGGLLAGFIAVLVAWGASAGLLLLAPEVSRIMGKRLSTAAERLMGLLLTVIAVQMMFSSIAIFVEQLRG